MDIYAEVLRAEKQIRQFIRETPVDYIPRLSKDGGSQIFAKLENLQYTGSFKFRGAMNKILALSPEQLARGIIAASSGNHGAAVAYASSLLKAKSIIFVPTDTSLAKTELIHRYGGEVRYFGDDCGITETHARDLAERQGLVYVSPYNDPDVISGQGTIAFELHNQMQNIDAVFVTVGGGGLVSGIAGYFRRVSPQTKIVGCLPENSPVMAESMKAGKIVDVPVRETISDATAGGIESGAITFEMCRTLIDEYVLVSEEEIKDAMYLFIENQHMLIEGAAGVAVAGYLQQQHRFEDQKVVLVICGANIGMSTLRTVLDQNK